MLQLSHIQLTSPLSLSPKLAHTTLDIESGDFYSIKEGIIFQS